MNAKSLVRSLLCMAAGVCLAGAGAAENKSGSPEAADWPQFLGPNHDGVVGGGTKLLDSWPKTGPKLLWKSDALPEAPTWGIGSPVVSGGKVYTFSCVFQPQSGVTPIDAEMVASLQDKKAGHEKDMEWITANQGKEVKTYHEFERMLRARWYNYTHGHWCARELLKHAKTLFDKGQKAVETFICLDAVTGKELWRKEVVVSCPPAPAYEGEGYGFSGVPAVCKDKAYFAGACALYCVDTKQNGAVVWQVKCEGSHGAPIVLNDVVYLMSKELAAFDAATGKELWRRPEIKSDYSTPGVWNQNGKTYLLCSCYGYRGPDPVMIYCVDAKDGKIAWKLNAGTHSVRATPVTSGDIMVLRGGGSTEAYRISPEKTEKLWTAQAGDHASTPVIFGDAVYCCTRAYSSRLVCVLNLKTGAILCSQDGRASTTSSSPALADGKIFIMDSSGGLYGFKATPDKYEEVGYVQSGAARCSSPAVAGGKLYLRLKDGVACYDLTAAGNP